MRYASIEEYPLKTDENQNHIMSSLQKVLAYLFCKNDCIYRLFVPGSKHIPNPQK